MVGGEVVVAAVLGAVIRSARPAANAAEITLFIVRVVETGELGGVVGVIELEVVDKYYDYIK